MSFQSKVDEFVKQTTPAWARAGYGDWRWLPSSNSPGLALDPAFPGRDVTVWHHQHVFSVTVPETRARIKAMLDNLPPFAVGQLTKDRP